MNEYYPHIFEPITIGGVTFKNRIFTAPTTGHILQTSNASSFPETPYIANYLEKAKGGVACVNCGGQKVAFTGKAAVKSRLDISEASGWRNFIHMTEAMHAYDAKCSYELIHFGSEGEYIGDAAKGIIYGCSDFVRSDGLHFYEMPYEEMDKLADRYAELAEYIKICGFDSLLLHGGHGTLLQEFVSPRGNHRKDEFGGSLENRAKFPIMVLDRIRQRVGRDLLIEYRISGSECVPGGFQLDECIEYVKMIQDKIDIIHISAGVVREPRLRAITHPTGFLPEGCNAYLAKAVKECPDIHIPVLTVGAFQQPEAIERVLSRGEADLVAMARGTIADPYTVQKMEQGRAKDIVPCIKCFRCLDEFKNTHHYNCSVNPIAGRETQLEWLFPRQHTPKRVGIVGGGPGGMETALLAADLGHRIDLFEGQDRLGGQLNDADVMDFKYDLRRYKDYLVDHVTAHPNITIHLENRISPEELQSMGFDAVVCAVGAVPIVPPIPGVDASHVMTAVDSFTQPDRVGDTVVVIGGGQVGCETAVHYAKQGKQVTVLEMRAALAPDAMRTYREELVGQVGDHAAAITGAKVLAIRDQGVEYSDAEGCMHTVPADTVLLAVGMRPLAKEAETFRSCAPYFRKLGDCVKVSNISKAVRSAYDVAMTL